MMTFLREILNFVDKTTPYWLTFVLALVLSLVLTPLVRAVAMNLGMVDAPSSRRINKVPIPRGGGLAVFAATNLATLVVMHYFASHFARALATEGQVLRLIALGGALCLVGLADDRFNLKPRVKLFGQIAVAQGVFWWAGLGFHHLFPALDPIVDCILTTFWIVGAVNAFNLIDGLDGLATGLACIATVGMAGAILFVSRAEDAIFYFAFLGACLGFLRYNFHPASVFLGDTGSMFLGYFLAVAPLATYSHNSMVVGVGVPLLAMGVPIFDTSLAIMRRSVRAVLSREECGRDEGNTRIMSADTDHLHHRILRRFVSQRKAAFALYALAALLVAIGLGGLFLRSRAVMLYIIGFMVVSVIIFRDMRRIELWDAGRLLDTVAHDRAVPRRRRLHLLAVPMLVVADISILVLVWLLASWVLGVDVSFASLRRWLPLRMVPAFLALVFFRAYSTLWARAMLSNYVRLGVAVVVGTAITSVIVIAFQLPHTMMTMFSFVYAAFSLIGLCLVRTLRQSLRDFFYGINAGRLADSADARRILVYGAGLRYRAFRRELVRSSGDRVIVGILDDDPLLRGQYIGGVRILGPISALDDIRRSLRVDAVVVACQLPEEKLAAAAAICHRCGVPVSFWTIEEKPL